MNIYNEVFKTRSFYSRSYILLDSLTSEKLSKLVTAPFFSALLEVLADGYNRVRNIVSCEYRKLKTLRQG